MNPGTPPSQPPVTDGSPPPFPAISDAVAIYIGPERLYDFFIPSHGSSLPTRYVFFRDSTFQLQFASARVGIFTYPGRYSRADATITFQWDGSGAGAPWGATGTLRGDTLTVQYNMNMIMSDFINGPYVLVR